MITRPTWFAWELTPSLVPVVSMTSVHPMPAWYRVDGPVDIGEPVACLDRDWSWVNVALPDGRRAVREPSTLRPPGVG